MDITKLEIENFLTISAAKMELDARGLLLIQGVNEDDPSAESNGAGKSSIVDALCWAIYGVTARGVSTDAVVNKTAKKNCQVSVTLDDGGKEYRIVRYRKHATGKNMVTISERDTSTGAGSDLSKGTDKETQDVINAVMGCSLDVFMAAVYAGQEKMPDLPGMTDKMLKMLIEEAAGVEVLAKAYESARAKHAVAKDALYHAMNSKVVAERNLLAADSALATNRVDRQAFDDDRNGRSKDELLKAVPIKKDIFELEAKLATTSEEVLLDEIETLTRVINADKAEQAVLIAKRQLETKACREVSALKAKVEIAMNAIKRAEAAVAAVDDKVGSPCGECGKAYHEDDLATAKSLRIDDLAKAKLEATAAAKLYRAALATELAATDDANSFAAAMTDVSEVAARQRDLSSQVNAIRELRRVIQSKKSEIEKVVAIAKMKLSEANPWQKTVEAKEFEVARIKTELDSVNASLVNLTAKEQLVADAVKVFGPAGVRAHILDTVTPYLNDRTQDYLGALSDGNIHAEWNTLTKNAKGELKEKFNIEVVNDKGAESFAGLSGGEKRKVRLATAMALQDMVASRASKPINILICDEIDHALDESGLERLMTMLERKARERGTVLIISHNSLSDWCSNIITVTKSGGFATVSGEISKTI